MHYLYRYVCILNVFFIYVYGQLSAINNLLLLTIINNNIIIISVCLLIWLQMLHVG